MKNSCKRLRDSYRSSWLQDSGRSWLSCQEGMGSEEEVVEEEEEVGSGANCGKKLGGGK